MESEEGNSQVINLNISSTWNTSYLHLSFLGCSCMSRKREVIEWRMRVDGQMVTSLHFSLLPEQHHPLWMRRSTEGKMLTMGMKRESLIRLCKWYDMAIWYTTRCACSLLFGSLALPRTPADLLPNDDVIDGHESSPIFWDYFDCLAKRGSRKRRGKETVAAPELFSSLFLFPSYTAIKILVRDKYHLARDLASGILAWLPLFISPSLPSSLHETECYRLDWAVLTVSLFSHKLFVSNNNNVSTCIIEPKHCITWI